MDCPLCGAEEETVVHFVTELDDVREQFGNWGDPGGCARGNIAVQRENRREGVEEHCIVGGDEEEKWVNKCRDLTRLTSVVRAHRGADKKAGPR